MTDLTFTESEREFYTAFVKILTHLQDRAIKAEREVESLRKELQYHRERIEIDSIMSMDSTSDPRPRQDNATSR